MKNIGLIGSADIVGKAIMAFFWFYLATLLEPEKYGEIFYYLSIAGIGSTLALFGSSDIMTVFTAKKIKIEPVFYLISLVIGGIASLLIIIIFYRIDIILVLFGSLLSNLIMGELLGKKLFATYTKYFLTQKILTLILGFGFYYMIGPEGIIYALGSSYVFFVWRVYKGLNSKVDFSLLKGNLSFITNNYLIQVAQIAKGQADKLVIAPILGFSLLGNYTLAFQVIATIMIISQIIFKYILPYEASGQEKSHLKKLTILWSIGISILGIVLTPYIIPVIFPAYIEVIYAIQIMLLHVIFGTISLMYISELLSLGKAKILLIARGTEASIVIVGMIILGQFFGIVGVAVAFVLSSVIQTIFLVLYIHTNK